MNSFKRVHSFQIELNLEVLVFGERGKLEYQMKSLSVQGRELKTNSDPHMASTLGFEPGAISVVGECSYYSHHATLAPLEAGEGKKKRKKLLIEFHNHRLINVAC